MFPKHPCQASGAEGQIEWNIKIKNVLGWGEGWLCGGCSSGISQIYHGISWDFLQFTQISSISAHSSGVSTAQDEWKVAAGKNCVRQLLLRHLQNILGSLWQGDNRIAWKLSFFPACVKTPSEACCSFTACSKAENGKETDFCTCPMHPQLSLSPVSGQKTFLRQWNEMFQWFSMKIFFPNIQY